MYYYGNDIQIYTMSNLFQFFLVNNIVPRLGREMGDTKRNVEETFRQRAHMEDTAIDRDEESLRKIRETH